MCCAHVLCDGFCIYVASFVQLQQHLHIVYGNDITEYNITVCAAAGNVSLFRRHHFTDNRSTFITAGALQQHPQHEIPFSADVLTDSSLL